MKILSQKYSVREFWLIVTMSHNSLETDKIMGRFMDVARSQLDVRVKLLDIFPWEPRLSEAIRKQKAFTSLFPKDAFTGKLTDICRKMDDSPISKNHGLRFFYGSMTEKTA
jgi:MinD-like ATPase involved in chromosome partitioning or flagellar assembly